MIKLVLASLNVVVASFTPRFHTSCFHAESASFLYSFSYSFMYPFLSDSGFVYVLYMLLICLVLFIEFLI